MVFARQLSILLDTLEISGSELAAYVKIDRTGISRMKSGSRQPKPNGTSMRKLLHGIISYCAENGKTAILQELISEEGASEEELTNLIMYQHAYNASSRYINTINEMLETLINIGR